MGVVRTVRGDVPAGELGTVLAHEHIVCSITEPQTIRESEVAEDLRSYRECGGTTIVELTNTGMGQDAAALARLSAATGVIIICGTGFYQQRYYPEWIRETTMDDLETFMVREIEQGVAGTDIRAGVIGEIGTSEDSITPDEEKVMRAAVRAAARTGAPLSTHTSFGKLALEQLRLIEAEGLPLSRVSIGHLDLIPDPDYHTEVATRGAYVQYDTFGKNQYQLDERRIACLVEMVRRGFAEQILLSNDISRADYLSSRGGWGYCHFLSTIVPRLWDAGLDETTVRLMLVDNPARFLSLSSPQKD